MSHKAAILTIGDELLIGQVLNSNSQWMSEKLTEIGWEVASQLTVGDDESSIRDALNFLLKKSDAIIIGGGLGPTHDDITLETLSRFFNTPLELDPEWIKTLEELFRSRNRQMTDNNRKQALLLKGATRIDNDCGTAAGQYLEEGKTSVFVVPGVPHEMKSMMERFILPCLGKKSLESGERILKTTLLTTGVGESALAARLDSFVRKVQTLPGVTLAFLPSPTSVRLRLQMRCRTKEQESIFEELASELQAGCGEDFFGRETDMIEALVINRMIKLQRTLALAESCTGGLITHRLTGVPGASKVLRGTLVPYQEELKTLELGISKSLLESQGVVSEKTVRAMAEGIRKKWNSDYGLATTGYLGPTGGDSLAALGTVWIALSHSGGTLAREYRYENHRERSKERAAQSAIDLIRRNLRP
ncbi:MAG: competence/damage-inducible protein A [Bdellovibrionales bacterium]|nr:competence/damage-inducible protein A [Bdellovibrionales bacterium]